MKKFTLMLLVAFAFGATSLFAQSRTISGKVTDPTTKEPIVGATIIVQGTQNGAYSLDGGEFVITNVNGAVNLEVSYVGYNDKIVPVAASATKVDILLEPSALKMDDVVVVAFGQADKKSLTGSVSVISSEKMESRPITDILTAVVGSSPGVQTTAASGVPGSNASIRIRGVGSITGSNGPLYVVDGIPFTTGDITAISPDDIANMSILKDASSTALYGARAANGVIMITTKSGRKDKVSFNVKINEGFTMRATPEYDKLNPEEYYMTQWNVLKNNEVWGSGRTQERASELANAGLMKAAGYNIYRDKSTKLQIADSQLVRGVLDPATGYYHPQFNNNAEIMPGYLGDLNWLDQVAKKGLRQNYNLSASGGSDKATYFGSIGYLNEKGYFDHTSTSRINGRLKVDFKPTYWLKVGTNLTFSQNNYANPYGNSSTGYSNPWYYAREVAPIYPMYNHYNATGEYILDSDGNPEYDRGYALYDSSNNLIKRERSWNSGRHVIMEGALNKSGSENFSVFGNAFAEITFLKDFTLTIDGSLNNYLSFSDYYRTPIIGDGAPTGTAGNTSSGSRDYNFKQLLNYNRQIGKHNVSVLLGHENYQSKYRYLNVTKGTEIFPGITELANYAALVSGAGYSTMYRTEGYFFRGNYNYDNKYFFNGSYRRDGSSKFSPENRWGNFWSVGASWIVSSEKFMENASWVDMLKVRASYGVVGNDSSLGRYGWQALYGLGTIGTKQDPMIAWSNPGDPDVKWETNKTFDVAIDFRLWNRVSGTIEFFDRLSDGLILSVPQPYTSGISSRNENAGRMFNRGVEFQVDVDVIRTKDWTWNLGLNATWVTNKITDLPKDNRYAGIADGSKLRKIHHSMYDYWLVQSGGIDPLDGASLYLWDEFDTAGSPRTWKPGKSYREYDGVKYTTMTTEARSNWSGTANPALYGALTTSLTWKNLTLDIMFNYKIGGKAIDNSYWSLMGSSSTASAYHTDILQSWTTPGQIAKYPRQQSNSSTGNGFNLNAQATNRLMNGSFLSLQNVTLSYKFPKKIAQKMTLSGLSIYASGENLWQVSGLKGFDATSTFTGVQDNSRFVTAAIFTFGINVAF